MTSYVKNGLKMIVVFLIGLGAGLGLMFLTSCSILKKYPQDNIVEEIAEEVIEMKTGLDIDLSPFSPEN